MRRASAALVLGQTAELVCRCAEAAEAPLSAAVVVECASKSPLVEVRPEAIAEVELRERAFPEQKIAQALLASGANQQVDLGCRICAMIDLLKQPVKILGRKIRIALGAPRRLHDAVLRRIVECYSQQHSGTPSPRLFPLLDGPKQVLAEPIAPPDHVDANRFLHAAAGLGKQILAEQA